MRVRRPRRSHHVPEQGLGVDVRHGRRLDRCLFYGLGGGEGAAALEVRDVVGAPEGRGGEVLLEGCEEGSVERDFSAFGALPGAVWGVVRDGRVDVAGGDGVGAFVGGDGGHGGDDLGGSVGAFEGAVRAGDAENGNRSFGWC